jgi:CheY-like chemotaxis protein/rubrerythrin
MKDIIDWLITIEDSANLFYNSAINCFSDDRGLKNFLHHIADDEADHYHIMVSASQYVATLPTKKSQITIDDSFKAKIETPFKRGLELLKNDLITKESLADIILEIEFSELNDIFIYVLNTLKAENRLFAHAVSRIHHHLRHVARYLNSNKYCIEKLQSFTKLQYEKKPKVLIVDDESTILELTTALLEDISDIDIATNGAEALEKIKVISYDLVVTDIGMPVMNGIELYQNSIPYFTKPNEHFLFHTGNLTNDLQCYFGTNDLTFLQKPYSVMQIRNAVSLMFHLSDIDNE